MNDQQSELLLSKIDRVIDLLETANKPVSKARYILDIIAIGATIAGFAAVIDVIKNWIR